MRRTAILLAILVAGCGAHRSGSPAWPKMAAKDTDGGESLAPRQGATSVAAAASDDDDDDDIKVVTTPTTVTPAATPSVTAPAATPAATEDPIQIEEITIEVDD